MIARKFWRASVPMESHLPSDEVDAGVASTMNIVVAGLLALIEARGAIVVHVTAATSGEGTTSVARGLAASAARADWCKTALLTIGAAGGRSSASESGLLLKPEMIDGAPVDVGILATTRFGAPNAAQLRARFAECRNKYVLTILDCPPVLAAPEIAATARLADGVLLVVGAGQVESQEVADAQAQLEQFDANIIGAILNKQQDYLPQFLAGRF